MPDDIAQGAEQTGETDAPKTPTLVVDVDYYQRIIDDPDVSEARKRELIEIIGAIVIECVAIGFGLHPVQQAAETRIGHNDIDHQEEEERLPERTTP